MDIKTALPIIVAALVLVSFIATFFSTKTWRASHVVLVIMIFLSSGVFCYLAAATLSVHKRYRTQIKGLEAQIAETKAIIDAYKVGTNDEEVLLALERNDVQLAKGGLKRIQADLYLAMLNRGRVWQDCEVRRVEQDGAATLVVGRPDPHNLEQNTILFVFEQGTVAEGARYLGEFQVAEIAEDSVTLRPVMQLDDREMQRVSGSNKLWALHEIMPIDGTDVFANMDEGELGEYLPPAVIQEYLKDGKEAAPNDPPERIVRYNRDGEVVQDENETATVLYHRALRDYEAEFHQLKQQRYVNTIALEQLVRDQASLNAAAESAQKDIMYREREKEQLTQDLEGVKSDRDAVAKHLKAIEDLAARFEQRVQEAYRNNLHLASQLAELQLAAAEAINRQAAASVRNDRP